VDGKAVFTVESLRTDAQRLHPVQQALVDKHASQCGFCTPGFAMSLFGLYKNARQPSLEQCQSALSGNLCRCTGYRPIVDAARAMYELAAPDDWRAPSAGAAQALNASETALWRDLQALRRDATFEYSAAGRTWFAPRTRVELIALYSRYPQARIVAGATDVALLATKAHEDLGDLIHVGEVGDLGEVDVAGDGIHIGAAVPLELAFAALAGEWPETAEAWDRFASIPIRNSGTLAGNVANGSPIGDSMPVLIALGAQVELLSPRGTRTLPLESFYLGYRKTARGADEVVVALHVPRRARNVKLRAYKVSKRYDQDISAVFACFAITVADGQVREARIGCGGVAAVPARAPRTEAALVGQPFCAQTLEAAARVLAGEFTPIDDMRASAAYRARVLGNLLRRFWHECGDGGHPTRADDLLATVPS
jgi:xanthine dehydrogenase small subunit